MHAFDARFWSRAFAGALISAFLACASSQTVVVWDKEGASEGDLAAARAACTAEGDESEVRVGAQRMDAELEANAFVKCMEARGFSWKTEPAPES